MKLIGHGSISKIATGCASDPELYPVTGKVTLGGKSYERLIVYFRPVEEVVTRHNLGVGETDKNGVLTLGTGVGPGIAAGKYRVSFSCYQIQGETYSDGENKADESSGPTPLQIVPVPYDADTNLDSSPVEFTVSSGENNFEFDIPAKPPQLSFPKAVNGAVPQNGRKLFRYSIWVSK